MERVDQDFFLPIKQEPKEEEHCSFGNQEPDQFATESLVLKFIKNKDGEYSVVPRITPEKNEVIVNTVIKTEKDQFNYSCEDFHIKEEKITIEYNELSSCVDTVKTREPTEGKNKKDGDTPFSLKQCPLCLYTNKTKFVKRHIQRVHVTITKHACPFCERRNFKEPLCLDSHILKNHSDIDGGVDRIKRHIFECSLCSCKTLKRNNFRRHLVTHDESALKMRLGTTIDRNSYRSAEMKSKYVIKQALSTTKYDCFHCSYTTKDKGSIIKHLRLHGGMSQLPFHCKECHKNFNEKNGLDSHIIKRHIENDELLKMVTNRVYEYELCDYKDVNKSKVIRHKKAKHVKKERKKMVKRKMMFGIVKK